MGLTDKLREKALEFLIKQIPQFMKGSWRTTLVAWATGIGIIANQVVALFDTDPTTVFDYSKLILAAGVFGIGALARDKGVSTEEQKAASK